MAQDVTIGEQTFVLPEIGRERIADNLRAFVMAAFPGKKVRVTVARATRRRSDDQNRYLWGVCYATLRDATGNDPEDLHEFFLGEWGGWDVIDVFGQKRRVPKRRSSKLTTAEFADYVAFIQQRAVETVGVYIPDPMERAA